MSFDLLLYGITNFLFLMGDGTLLVQRLPGLFLAVFFIFVLFAVGGSSLLKINFWRKQDINLNDHKFHLFKVNLFFFVLALMVNISIGAINPKLNSKLNLAQLQRKIQLSVAKDNKNKTKTIFSTLPKDTNIVIFLLESVTADYVRLKDLELFQDAASVIDVNHFFIPTSHSSNSIASLLCGCYSNDLNYFRSNRFSKKKSLPGLLSKSGYSSSYIYSGPGHYEGLAKIIENSGMELIDSKKLIQLMPQKKFKQYYWGLDDISLYEYSKLKLKEHSNHLGRVNLHDKAKPLFMIYGFSNSHSPYYTPHLSKAQRKRLNYIQRYVESIKHSVSVINQILKEFKLRKLYEKTLFILMSDHGESFGDHGYWRHNFSLYNAETKVPFMISHPSFRKIPLDKRPNVATILDVYPTIAHLLGMPKPKMIQGRSFIEQGYRLRLKLSSWANKSNYGYLVDRYKFNIFNKKHKILISKLAENDISTFKINKKTQPLLDTLHHLFP